MHYVRRSQDRGHANHGWLDSHHTFSFADYYDPKFTGFGTLRVLNDDRVAPGAGFPTHPHRDMEILSYVVEGALEHRDSMGNGSIIRPGDVQRMTAGTGVTHSEYNKSGDEGLRFLQLWIIPDKRGLAPSYEQKYFGEDRNNQLKLVASPTGEDGSVIVHQDVKLYASVLEKGATVTHQASDDRQIWLQVVSGTIEVQGETLGEGDGLAALDEQELRLVATAEANFLLFDLQREES